MFSYYHHHNDKGLCHYTAELLMTKHSLRIKAYTSSPFSVLQCGFCPAMGTDSYLL